MYSTALHPPRTILEVFEFLPEGTLCQLINNSLVLSPPTSVTHQRISKTIFRQLNAFIEENRLGEVLFAPLDIYLDERNVFQPDIIFISKKRLEIIGEKIQEAPDLVIEILSRGTEKYDRGNKKAVYEKHGVKEYWIVDPVSKNVSGYQLRKNKFHELPGSKGLIESPLLKITIKF